MPRSHAYHACTALVHSRRGNRATEQQTELGYAYKLPDLLLRAGHPC